MSKTTDPTILTKPTLPGASTIAEAALALAEGTTVPAAAPAAPDTTAPVAVPAGSNRAFFAPDGYRRLTINLPEALHNVLRPGTLLGYTEHMPAFLQRLRDAGILSTTQIENHNVAPQSANLDHDIQKMSEYQKQIFQKYTEWDAYFYQICTSIIPPNEG